MTKPPEGFLWGAATAGHQIEGNNTNSNVWALEHAPDSPLLEHSGDACDSYLHWSLLDNYEWGSWAPTFGLVSVDRQTFERTVKPSARWYGALARQGFLPA